MSALSGRLSRGFLADAGIVAVVSVATATALIAMFTANKAVGFGIVGVALFVLGFALAGNQRLFCLWGLVISAPLALGQNFWIVEHTGGAGSIAIELPDLFLLPLLAFILRDWRLGTLRHLRLSPVAFWWGALILLGVLDVITGPMRHLPLLEVVRMVKCFAVFFVIVNEVVRLKQFKHVVAALIVGVGLQVTIALIQYIFKADLHLQVLGEALPEATKSASQSVYNIEGSAGVFRVSGLLGHPNMLSAYLAMLLPVCLALLFSRIASIYKLIVGGVIALGLIVLVLTLSRSGWLSFGVAFLVLFIVSLLHPRLRSRYPLGRLAIVGLLAVAIAVSWGVIDKRLVKSDPGSVNFRIEFMGIAWDMVEDRPVLGFGLNTFVFDLPGRTKYGGPRGLTQAFGDVWPVVHNTYLIVWTEQGTVGFLFFAGFYLSILWLGFRNILYFSNEIPFTVSLGCVSGFIAIMVDGMSSFFIREPGPARVFWIVVGLIVAINYWNRVNLPAPRLRAAARRGTVAPAADATPAQ